MKRLVYLSLLSLAGALPARSEIIYSGLQNIAIPTDFFGIFLSIETGVTSGAAFAGWDINAFFGGAGLGNSPLFQPVRIGPDNDDPILALDPGSLVDASRTYASGFGGSGDPEPHLGTGPSLFGAGEDGYLGFRLTTDGGSGPYYGWMHVILTAAMPGGTIVDWAYEDGGGAIAVAAVPEPTRAVLATLGFLAVFTRRRAWRQD